MTAQTEQPNWVRLFRVACDLIKQVNARDLIIDHWSFGGGTALMLQIGHRESRDVDIFLRDPQLLSFLDPQRHDFTFKLRPSEHASDGTGFVKFAFAGVGEVDFIVSQPKTATPTRAIVIEGERTLRETVPEIIAKKIVHRGATIKPRDIFDIAAASQQHEASIIAGLRSYRTEVEATLKRLDALNPEFVRGAIAELMVSEEYWTLANTSLERAKQVLQAV